MQGVVDDAARWYAVVPSLSQHAIHGYTIVIYSSGRQLLHPWVIKLVAIGCHWSVLVDKVRVAHRCLRMVNSLIMRGDQNTPSKSHTDVH